MAATAPTRSARSTAPGVSNGTPASAMLRLARVMRCSMALSLTRKARAICWTVRPRDDAQRDRDLLGGRQIGMAADEQQAQNVVAVVLVLEPLRERGFGIVQIREHLVGRQFLLAAAAARRIDADIAPDEDQPGGGIARRTILPPMLEGAQAGLLEGLLGGVEVAEVAQQRPDRLGAGRGQRRIDPVQLGIGHFISLPGRYRRTGRIS